MRVLDALVLWASVCAEGGEFENNERSKMENPNFARL